MLVTVLQVAGLALLALLLLRAVIAFLGMPGFVQPHHSQSRVALWLASLTPWKDTIEALQSIATVIAFIAAGSWAYNEFLLQEEGKGHAKLTQTIISRQISPQWYWVQAAVTVENVGKASIKLTHSTITAYQLMPLPKVVLDDISVPVDPVPPSLMVLEWPTLCQYSRPEDTIIPAGESDVNYYEFILPSWLKTVEIRSIYDDISHKDYDWVVATVQDLALVAGKQPQGAPTSDPDAACAHDNGVQPTGVDETLQSYGRP